MHVVDFHSSVKSLGLMHQHTAMSGISVSSYNANSTVKSVCLRVHLNEKLCLNAWCCTTQLGVCIFLHCLLFLYQCALIFNIRHVTVPSAKAHSSQYTVKLILSGSGMAQSLITLRHTYIESPQQQQGGLQANRKDQAEDGGRNKRPDAVRLRQDDDDSKRHKHSHPEQGR